MNDDDDAGARDAGQCEPGRSAAATDDVGRQPLNLWGDIPRRAVPSAPSPLAAARRSSSLPAGAAPPPVGAHPRATEDGTAHAADGTSHAEIGGDAPNARGARRRPPAARRRKLLVRGAVAVAVIGSAAAIIVPSVRGGAQEPRLARPTVSAVVDPAAMRPELIFGEDHAAEMPLPAPLTGEPTVPTGFKDERWRLTAEQAADLWWSAQPADAAPDEPGFDRGDSLVTATPVVPGAAHEANVSDVALVTLSAYGPHGTAASRRELVALDVTDGSLLWTRSVESTTGAPCQVTGRGAHVACVSSPETVASDPTVAVDVLATRTGKSVAWFESFTCTPQVFLQTGTHLYWAGSATQASGACLGGGREHFAEILDEDLGVQPVEALTLTSSGPLLRTPTASVVLTDAGWRGYRGRVEPGPPGVVVRQVAGETVSTMRLDTGLSENITTIVSDVDGATLMTTSGPAWRRLDLMPDSAGDPRLSELVGIDDGVYEPTGQQRLSLRDAGGAPYVVPAFVPAPTALPSGPTAYAFTDSTETMTAALSWSWDGAFTAAPAQGDPSPASLVTVIGSTSFWYEWKKYATTDSALGTLEHVEADFVAVDADGSTRRLPLRVLVGINVPANLEGDQGGDGPYVSLDTASTPVAVVGSVLVAADSDGIVAVS